VQSVLVRSRLVGGVLFEYVPDRRAVRIRRRGLMFEVFLDQLETAHDAGCAVLRADAVASGAPPALDACSGATRPEATRPDGTRDGHDI